jgi:hypothetical protein
LPLASAGRTRRSLPGEAPLLVTLKLYLADGRERQLSYEIDEHDTSTASEILQRLNEDGWVKLGDRDSCSLAAVERVEFVRPAGASAPEWIEEGKPPDATLRDEDVAAALREQHPSQGG